MNNLSRLIDIAAGRKKADLVFKNANIVDVFTGSIKTGNLAISMGRIIGIGDYQGETEIDAQGKYIVPGLVDAHVHIESSMVQPSEFARAVVPRGTTTLVADPHEIANVCGLDGIHYMLEATEDLPLNVFMMLPSCVPATSYENSGAILNAKELSTLINHPRVLGLGEMMNYPGVIQAEPHVVDKLLMAHHADKIIDGHGPDIKDFDLNAYSMGGIHTEHECSTKEEMLDRLSNGMYIAIREGTAAKNLQNLIGAITPQNERRCMWCTDDRHLEDIFMDGHIDNNVRLAIQLGLDPITAIKMATINPAECYGLKWQGALAPGYIADMIIVDNLENFEILEVYKEGQLVAKDYQALFETKSIDASKVTETVNTNGIHLEDFDIKLTSDNVNIIGLKANSLITKRLQKKLSMNATSTFDYSLNPGIQKIAVIERHQKTNNIALGLVENFDIKGGAIASTIVHDSHNIIVIGDNDDDMLKATQEVIKTGGGIAIASHGKIIGSQSLAIAGLMSLEPMEEVEKNMKEMLKIAYKVLKVNKEVNPFMTLAFLGLPVIPDIKITDMGLFDVSNFSFINLCN